MKTIVHKLISYTNKKGDSRIMIVLRGEHPLIALAQFGSVVVKKGILMEEVEKQFKQGQDVSNQIAWGSKIEGDGPFYQVSLK